MLSFTLKLNVFAPALIVTISYLSMGKSRKFGSISTKFCSYIANYFYTEYYTFEGWKFRCVACAQYNWQKICSIQHCFSQQLILTMSICFNFDICNFFYSQCYTFEGCNLDLHHAACNLKKTLLIEHYLTL